jgi:hypothetical protein
VTAGGTARRATVIRAQPETGGLEFHHVVPFAKGGPSNPENLELRCRAHNAFEAKEVFGDWRPRARKNRGASASALAGQS